MSLLGRAAPVALALIAALALAACGGGTPSDPAAEQPSTVVQSRDATPLASEVQVAAVFADVTDVTVSGAAGSYTFNVTVSSPDTGCDQYADWWEVLSENGDLLYRRILLHSHVGEQPFSRSGGAVSVDADTTVIVRAHMNSGGYAGRALRGSAASGFVVADLAEGFAAAAESAPPLPSGCAF